VQSAGNHQVKGEPQIVVYSDYNALTDSPQFAHVPALHTGKRRLRGSQQKGARQPYPFEWLTDYARLEGTDVGDNIRQFWHGYQFSELARRTSHPICFVVLVGDDSGKRDVQETRPAFVRALHAHDRC
jgi:hypothetical protein